MPWPAGNLGAELGSPPCRCVCVDGAPLPVAVSPSPQRPLGPPKTLIIAPPQAWSPIRCPVYWPWLEGCLPMYQTVMCRQACLAKVLYFCRLLQLQRERSTDIYLYLRTMRSVPYHECCLCRSKRSRRLRRSSCPPPQMATCPGSAVEAPLLAATSAAACCEHPGQAKHGLAAACSQATGTHKLWTESSMCVL